MSSDIAINVKNLSKRYEIFDKPRDRLKQFILPRFQRLGRFPIRKYYREHWALKDLSFQAKKGETIGIIGSNGSGKSTLLQLLCGILSPTAGDIKINGRISALLELGAGFNPEFTGRENVFINASILGLSSDEIQEKFLDIINFADIGDFIDQPVKCYSSGMFVRLAFAVAISVDPDILIVDEALSVGDINFRNKCMKRIYALQASGVVVLFVSHDLGTVQTICDRAIWIHDGEVEEEGPAVSVCQNYYSYITETKSPKSKRTIIQQSSNMAKFTQIAIGSNNSRDHIPIFKGGEKIEISFELEVYKPVEKIVFAVSIYQDEGDWLVGQTSRERGIFWNGHNKLLCGKIVLEPNILGPGNYFTALGAYSEDLTLCYALTDLTVPFHVRWEFPTWGKIIAPCKWIEINV
jgi:ABC-type polysaccharide/polyol phosphate transport system ATPase subunit